MILPGENGGNAEEDQGVLGEQRLHTAINR